MPTRSVRILRVLVAAILLSAALAGAQFRMGPVQVTIMPDRPDWNYALGEKAIFEIKILKNKAPLPGAKLNWAVGSELLPPIRTGTVELSSERTTRVDVGTRNDPGFLQIRATVTDEGRTYNGLGTVGFAPEQIKPVVQDPAGFDAFWQQGKEALAKIPINEKRTPYPEKTTETLNAYQVSFQNVAGTSGWGAGRMHGILTEPKAPGKYPALLRVPGIVKEALENRQSARRIDPGRKVINDV